MRLGVRVADSIISSLLKAKGLGTSLLRTWRQHLERKGLVAFEAGAVQSLLIIQF